MTAALEKMLALGSYEALEWPIRRSDLDSLLARWECGCRLLAERGDRERLPKGRLGQLARALALSKAELKNRIQFAEEHPTESAVRVAFDSHGSWSEICARGMGDRGACEPTDNRLRKSELAAVVDLKPH